MAPLIKLLQNGPPSISISQQNFLLALGQVEACLCYMKGEWG